MKRKHYIRTIPGIVIIAVAGWLVIFQLLQGEKLNAFGVERPIYTTVSIDDIVKDPEKFTAPTQTTGKILSVDKSSGMFIMGCDDACIMLPVTYKGQLPVTGKTVTITGRIKKNNSGQYFFEAEQIQ